MDKILLEKSISEMSDLLDKKEVSSVELTELDLRSSFLVLGTQSLVLGKLEVI